MTDKQIKYSPLSIPIVTIVLAVLCVLFILLLTKTQSFDIGAIFVLFVTIIFFFFLLTWTIIFFIPLILGKPALIISKETLYVTSISQKIPWDEIQKTKIKSTRSNYVVSIYVNDEDRIFVKPKFFIKNLVCAANSILYSTPFSFWTMPLKGRAVDIYNDIKSAQTIAKL